ncbi:sensor histidine kinase [Niveispirillum fermenti]|uniref:sensor histidine kinase n=1 Tax=Niveispirillum fermenti TaxID=1233113 RepID=UPI003A8C68F3
MRRGSLGLRLLVLAAIWVLLAVAGAGILLTDIFRHHAEAELARHVEQHVDELTATLTRSTGNRVISSRDLSDPRFQRPLSGTYWQVSDTLGVVLRSRSLWDQTLRLEGSVPDDGGLHRRTATGPDGEELLVWSRRVRLPEMAGPVEVSVAVMAADLKAATRRFAGVLALSLGVLALGLLAAAMAQVRLGLVPLDRLRKALADLRAGRSTRLVGAFPSEVQPLADDLNQLLSDNAEMVERARTQAGNLAHALRTPLTIITNSAAGLSDPAEARLIAAEADRMRRQIDRHLTRARAAAMAKGAGLRTPVAATLRPLARTITRLHPDKNIQVTVDGDDGLLFRGEAQDLQEMAGNLLDNAAKWGRRTVTVTITAVGTATGPGMVRIGIADDGPGIPPAARDAVLARGVRLDEATPGSGLGLAIVDDLARLYGGSLALETAAAGGLLAVLTLPGA